MTRHVGWQRDLYTRVSFPTFLRSVGVNSRWTHTLSPVELSSCVHILFR